MLSTEQSTATPLKSAQGSAAPEFCPVIVVPTYNNAHTLPDVLQRIERLDIPILVVNDGSTDATAGFLQQWQSSTGRVPRILVSHTMNRGKAAALRSGFDEALRRGFTHALTIDSDGQLAPEEVPTLLKAAAQSPHAMILGVRDESAPDYPTRSRVGRRVSNLLVRLESGAHITDTQCGFRVYPLDLVRFVRCRSQRYGFETAILTRAAWAGCEFVQVPVSCLYDDPQRVTHFRPWADSWRGVGMHFPLVVRALTPWPYRRWKQAGKRESPKSFFKHLIESLNPFAAYRELRRDVVAGPALAVGVAWGVWIANWPVYGLQTILALYVARRLHLNPLAVVLGTQISMPPMGPLLIAAGVTVGHLLLHGALPLLQDLNIHHLGWARVIGPALLDWTVGGVFLGFWLGVITFLILWRLLRQVRVEEEPVCDPVSSVNNR